MVGNVGGENRIVDAECAIVVLNALLPLLTLWLLTEHLVMKLLLLLHCHR
jgi:hypothetical protein